MRLLRGTLASTVEGEYRTAIGRFFGVVADPSAWGALFYMLLALVTGTLCFSVVVAGLSTTLGLLALIIGVPFALLFLATMRATSLAGGRIVEGLLGVRMPRRPRTTGRGGNIWERVKGWFSDYRTASARSGSRPCARCRSSSKE